MKSHPNREDQPDAALIYRLPHNATIGPILSSRAFEFERLYGLDLWIPDQQDDEQIVWVTAC